jgi:uncharacterized membrane protein YphA (DoxX/SURF4 family)
MAALGKKWGRMSKDSSEQPNDSGRSWAILFARLVLGLIFFMAGVYKVFRMTPVGHAHKYFVDPYADTFLPSWSLWLTGLTVPVVELVAGALLIIGLRVREALLALGFVLVLVTFGHLLKEPLYAFHTHVIPRLALLLFILLLPREADHFSLDQLFAKKRK